MPGKPNDNLTGKQVAGLLLIPILMLAAYLYSTTYGRGAGQALSATVTFTGTQFVVANRDSSGWTDVRCEINGGLVAGGYVLNVPDMKPGDEVSLAAMTFAKADGTRFNPFQMKAQKFVITATRIATSKSAIYVGGWP